MDLITIWYICGVRLSPMQFCSSSLLCMLRPASNKKGRRQGPIMPPRRHPPRGRERGTGVGRGGGSRGEGGDKWRRRRLGRREASSLLQLRALEPPRPPRSVACRARPRSRSGGPPPSTPVGAALFLNSDGCGPSPRFIRRGLSFLVGGKKSLPLLPLLFT
jgi:hypothetical protein